MNFITKLLRFFFVKTKTVTPLFGAYKILWPRNNATASYEWLWKQLNNGIISIYSGPVPVHNLTAKNNLLGVGRNTQLKLDGDQTIKLDKHQLVNVFCAGVVSFVVLSPKSRRLPRVIIPVHGLKNDRVQFSATNAIAGDDVYITRLEF